MKSEFKSEDFSNSLMFHETPEQLANQANKILPEIKESWKAEMLKDAVVVYSNYQNLTSPWDQNKWAESNTHKALLIEIQKIGKECEHTPRFTSNAIDNTCKWCNKPIKAKWNLDE